MLNGLIPQWPAPAKVRAFSTFRTGGHSVAPWDSFNLALHVGDTPEVVAQNRALLHTALALTAEPAWLMQVHGNVVIQAEDYQGVVDADASIAFQPTHPCIVMTADCLPVLLTDTKGSFVAALHCGWRSLQALIIQKTIEQAQTKGVNPKDILAWLGPAIGPTAFEVGPEVPQAFLAQEPYLREAFIPAAVPHKWHADLYAIARLQLNNLGVTQVFGGGHCTYTDSEHFFSYRRNATTGRMATLIWLTS